MIGLAFFGFIHGLSPLGIEVFVNLRTGIFVRPTISHRLFGKVTVTRRRWRCPLKGAGIPWVVAFDLLTNFQRDEDVSHNQNFFNNKTFNCVPNSKRTRYFIKRECENTGIVSVMDTY